MCDDLQQILIDMFISNTPPQSGGRCLSYIW